MTVGEHNLARLAHDAFERRGNRPGAVLYEGRSLDSADLFGRIAPLAGGLVDLGVAPGDRVVVFMANSPDVGVIYNAIWWAGAVATPVIFLLPPAELRHVLENSGAVAVVTTPEFLATVQTAAEGVDTVRHVVCAEVDEAGGPSPVVGLAELEQADPVPIVARADHDLAGLLYTGGTTGRSKGVMQTHEAFWRLGLAAYEAQPVHQACDLVPLPLSHAYGLGLTIASGHTRDPATSVLMRWFDPAGALDLVEKHDVERAFLVPAMVRMLLAQPLEERRLDSLRWVASGAAPLDLEALAEMERRIPGAEVLEGYGLTESATFATANLPGQRKVGTVGRPFPGVELRTVGEDGQDAEVGEVWIRSPGVMQGYWRDPEATAAALADGWLRTGDIGKLDDDGYLTILDRKKDVIIRGGFNVYPHDVEDALTEHPGVAAAGVVGAPDRERGEEVVAFVQLVDGAQAGPDELVAWARERLGGYRYPRRVHVVEALPLTPVLKLDRKALRERLKELEQT